MDTQCLLGSDTALIILESWELQEVGQKGPELDRRRLGRKALNSVLDRRGPATVVNVPWTALDKCLV